MSEYLINKKYLDFMFISLGEKQFKDIFISQARQSGKTTALALMIIAHSIQNPGRIIPIHDHFRTRQADFMLFNVIDKMIRNLNLEGLELVKHPNPCIKFNLYEVNPKEYLKEKIK